MINNYSSHPNQKHVRICKEEYMKKPKDGKLAYGKISIKGSQYAMKDLSPAQFQVWFYFAKNEHNFDFWVSPATALSEYGISKSTFHKATTKLLSKGYLVPRDNKGNEFDFYQIPPKELEGFIVCHKNQEEQFRF